MYMYTCTYTYMYLYLYMDMNMNMNMCVWSLHVSLNEYRSLADWLGRSKPGPVRRGALFRDPLALICCVLAATCNQTFQTLAVSSDWPLDIDESLALSSSPGLCGACQGRPAVALAYEGLEPGGWISSYALSTRVTVLHGGDRYTVCLCTMDEPRAPANVLLTLIGPSLDQDFVCILGDIACSLEVAGHGALFQTGNLTLASTCGGLASGQLSRLKPLPQQTNSSVARYDAEDFRSVPQAASSRSSCVGRRKGPQRRHQSESSSCMVPTRSCRERSQTASGSSYPQTGGVVLPATSGSVY